MEPVSTAAAATVTVAVSEPSAASAVAATTAVPAIVSNTKLVSEPIETDINVDELAPIAEICTLNEIAAIENSEALTPYNSYRYSAETIEKVKPILLKGVHEIRHALWSRLREFYSIEWNKSITPSAETKEASAAAAAPDKPSKDDSPLALAGYFFSFMAHCEQLAMLLMKGLCFAEAHQYLMMIGMFFKLLSASVLAETFGIKKQIHRQFPHHRLYIMFVTCCEQIRDLKTAAETADQMVAEFEIGLKNDTEILAGLLKSLPQEKEKAAKCETKIAKFIDTDPKLAEEFRDRLYQLRESITSIEENVEINNDRIKKQTVIRDAWKKRSEAIFTILRKATTEFKIAQPEATETQGQQYMAHRFGSGRYLPDHLLSINDYDVYPTLKPAVMKDDAQVHELVLKEAYKSGYNGFTIEPSAIHGFGLKAKQNFKAGDIIGIFEPRYLASLSERICGQCGYQMPPPPVVVSKKTPDTNNSEIKSESKPESESEPESESDSGIRCKNCVDPTRYCSDKCYQAACTTTHTPKICRGSTPLPLLERSNDNTIGMQRLMRHIITTAVAATAVETPGNSLIDDPIIAHMIRFAQSRILESRKHADPAKFCVNQMELRFQNLIQACGLVAIDPRFDFHLFTILTEALTIFAYPYIGVTGANTVGRAALGIYSVPLFINHSCTPNADWLVKQPGRCLYVLKAISDIKERDEIFIDYTARPDNVWVRESVRHKELMIWGIMECNCRLCEVEQKLSGKEIRDIVVDALMTTGYRKLLDNEANMVLLKKLNDRLNSANNNNNDNNTIQNPQIIRNAASPSVDMLASGVPIIDTAEGAATVVTPSGADDSVHRINGSDSAGSAAVPT
jgi:hypothetical protein